ncbi:hypothetical protein ACOSP7_022010 [Xanthoceras sorbifolium]
MIYRDRILKPKSLQHQFQAPQHHPSTGSEPLKQHQSVDQGSYQQLEIGPIHAHTNCRGDRDRILKPESLQHQFQAPQHHPSTGSEPPKQHQSVNQGSYQQLKIGPDLIRSPSTKEKEGEGRRGWRVYGSRVNPVTSYQ